MKYLYCFIVYLLSCICCFVGFEVLIGSLEYLKLGVFAVNIRIALQTSFVASSIAVLIYIIN